LPRARQNVADRAVRAGPRPVTTRQPLTWTVTGGNGRSPAANANRSEPRNCAGQFTGLRGILGSPHSAVARARTGKGSLMVVPRGRTMAGSSSWRATVRLTTTLVSLGISTHRATLAGPLPPATGAVPGPLAAAERPAATWLPQAASMTMAPTAIAPSAAPSGRTRRTIILTPTLGGIPRAIRREVPQHRPGRSGSPGWIFARQAHGPGPLVIGRASRPAGSLRARLDSVIRPDPATRPRPGRHHRPAATSLRRRLRLTHTARPDPPVGPAA
jgi:hypothetical protein